MKRHLYYTVPLIIWAGFIFSMSHMNATSSSGLSNDVGLLIGNLLVPGFREMLESEQVLYAEGIQFLVRKAAHMCEYMVLGVLVSRFVCNVWSRWYTKYWSVTAFVMGMLYAVSDEIHQLFIPGRSGQITDVLIDSTGVLIGVALYCGYLRFKIKE